MLYMRDLPEVPVILSVRSGMVPIISIRSRFKSGFGVGDYQGDGASFASATIMPTRPILGMLSLRNSV